MVPACTTRTEVSSSFYLMVQGVWSVSRQHAHIPASKEEAVEEHPHSPLESFLQVVPITTTSSWPEFCHMATAS